MDFTVLALPAIMEAVSNYSAVLTFIYLWMNWMTFRFFGGRGVSLADIEEMYRTLKYKGLPLIPAYDYNVAIARHRQRAKQERNLLLFSAGVAVFTTVVCGYANTLFINWIASRFVINPYAGLGIIAKLLFMAYGLVTGQSTVFRAMLLLSLAFSGTVVRILILLPIAQLFLWSDKDAEWFTSLYFQTFQVHRGLVSVPDPLSPVSPSGRPTQVYYLTLRDPTGNFEMWITGAWARIGAVSGPVPQSNSASLVVRFNAGNHEAGFSLDGTGANPALFELGPVQGLIDPDHGTVYDGPSRLSVVFKHLPGSYICDSARHGAVGVVTLPCGEAVIASYQVVEEDVSGEKRFVVHYTCESAAFTLPEQTVTQEPVMAGSAASQAQTLAEVRVEGPAFVSGRLMFLKGSFTYRVYENLQSTMHRPFGYVIFSFLALDGLEALASIASGALAGSRFVEWVKGVSADPKAGPVKCSFCAEGHISETCPTRSDFRARAWKLHSWIGPSLAAVLAALLTKRGWDSLKLVARGFKAGITHLISYDGDALYHQGYQPVSPLVPEAVGEFPILNMVVELSLAAKGSPGYASKKGYFTSAVANGLFSAIRKNPSSFDKELQDFSQDFLRDDFPQDRLVNADKATELGMLLNLGHAGAVSAPARLAEDWKYKASFDLGGVTASILIEAVKAPGGSLKLVYKVTPLVVLPGQGVFSCPKDPELDIVDAYSLGVSGTIAIGGPVAIYALYRWLSVKNVPGSACSGCGKVVRDHLDGACKKAGPPTVTIDDHALAPEGRTQYCRLQAGRCRTNSCPYDHRDFSVVNYASFYKAVKKGDRVVCLHHDPAHRCVHDVAPGAVCNLELQVECVNIHLDGASRPTGSVTIPPARVYYSDIAASSPLITLLNLRAPPEEAAPEVPRALPAPEAKKKPAGVLVVPPAAAGPARSSRPTEASARAEGVNDPQNYNYRNSARHHAHREDHKSNNRRVNTHVIQGSADITDYLDAYVNHSDDPLSHLWDLANAREHRYGGRHHELMARAFEEAAEEIIAERGYDEDHARGLRSLVERSMGYSVYESDPYYSRKDLGDIAYRSLRRVAPAAADEYDRMMDEEGKKKAKSSDPCHGFANGSCPYGQSCGFSHVAASDIPPSEKICPHANACPYGAKCVFKAPKPEATVARNPPISIPKVKPAEFTYSSPTDGETCTVYAWKVAAPRVSLIVPYHVFGKTCPVRDSVHQIYLKTAMSTVPVSMEVRMIHSTNFGPSGTNSWIVAMCLVEVVSGWDASKCQGLGDLTLGTTAINGNMPVTLYPSIKDHVCSGTGYRVDTFHVYSHTVSMPAKFGGEVLIRCGRLLVGPSGPVGIHVAGDEESGTNYMFPMIRLACLFTGLDDPTSADNSVTAVVMAAQGVVTPKHHAVMEMLNLQMREVPPFHPPAPYADCYGAPVEGPLVVGYIPKALPPKPAYIRDEFFHQFAERCLMTGQYAEIAAAYFQGFDLYLRDEPQFPELTPEAIVSAASLFTHDPARFPRDPAVLEGESFKFFRSLRAVGWKDYYWDMTWPEVEKFFIDAAEEVPYRFLQLDEVILDMEQHGNEYKSAGAGVTKNLAFRHPAFSRLYDDYSPGTLYVFANKVAELRKRGKPMRQFIIQDPVSYAREVSFGRWFIDRIINSSLGLEAPGPYFNTFSPFGDPARLLDRACADLQARPDELWYWCYDGKASECNNFEPVMRSLGRLAVKLGAPPGVIQAWLDSELSAIYFDTNSGRVYSRPPGAVAFNASGRFLTTLLTALMWTNAGKHVCAYIAYLIRAVNYGAGDDNVFISVGNPGPMRGEIETAFRLLGLKIEFEGEPQRFVPAAPDTFNFCSVTYTDLTQPYMTRAKRSSCLPWRPVNASDQDRADALSSYCLTSYHDPLLGPFFRDYADFFEARTGVVVHRHKADVLDRLYRRGWDADMIDRLPARFMQPECFDPKMPRIVMRVEFDDLPMQPQGCFLTQRQRAIGSARVISETAYDMYAERGIAGPNHPGYGTSEAEGSNPVYRPTPLDDLWATTTHTIVRNNPHFPAALQLADENAISLVVGEAVEALQSGSIAITGGRPSVHRAGDSLFAPFQILTGGSLGPAWESSGMLTSTITNDMIDSDYPPVPLRAARINPAPLPYVFSEHEPGYNNLPEPTPIRFNAFAAALDQNPRSVAFNAVRGAPGYLTQAFLFLATLAIVAGLGACCVNGGQATGRVDRSFAEQFTPPFELATGFSMTVNRPHKLKIEDASVTVVEKKPARQARRAAARAEKPKRAPAQKAAAAAAPKAEAAAVKAAVKAVEVKFARQIRQMESASGEADEARRRTHADAVVNLMMNCDRLQDFTGVLPAIPVQDVERQFGFRRFSNKNITLGARNIAVTGHNQTNLAFAIDLATGTFAAGDLIIWNPGRPDGTYLDTDVPTAFQSAIGVTSGTGCPLVPQANAGFILTTNVSASNPADEIPIPTPMRFTGNAYYMVTATTGVNTGKVAFYAMVATDTPFLLCGSASIDGVSRTGNGWAASTYVTLKSRPGVVVGLNTTMTLTAITYDNGNDVASAVDFTGNAQFAPGDKVSAPGYGVAVNWRFKTFASSLSSGLALTNWVCLGGGAGPFKSAPSLKTADLTDPRQVCVSRSTLAANSQQYQLEDTTVSDPKWAGFNIAARMSEPQGSMVVPDLAYLPGFMPSSKTATMNAISGVNCENQSSGWGSCCQISITAMDGNNTPASSNAGYPCTLRADAWLVKFLGPLTGFPTQIGEYTPHFYERLQELATFPGLASYHSFKDYIKRAWRTAGSVVKDVGGRALAAALNAGKDVAAGAIMAALG